MGRWKLIEDFGKVVDTGITNIYCESNPNAEVAKMLHNADCDAYENQIAELEEERDAAVEFAHTVEREFAAATATLERLREVFNQECTWGSLACPKARAILYPQPQPPEETTA